MPKLRKIRDRQRRARLGVRHLLAASARKKKLSEVVEALVALHSSDPATVFLSAAVRLVQPSIESIERELYATKSKLVRHHAMRRTLWVMSLPLAQAAHASTTAKLATSERKRLIKMLEENGEQADGASFVDDALTQLLGWARGRDTFTTKEVGEELPELRSPIVLAPGKKYSSTVGAHTRLLPLLAFQGILTRREPPSSWTNSQYRWAFSQQVFGQSLTGPALEEAAAIVMRAYLERFGPVTALDAQWWTGWTKTQTRKALAAAGAVEVAVESGPAYVAQGDDDVEEPGPWLSLLPGLDPTIMGYKERGFYLDPADQVLLFDANGNGGHMVVVDGQIVGGWTQRKDGTLAYELTKRLPKDRRVDLDEACHALESFWGATRFKLRFPAPLQKKLYE